MTLEADMGSGAWQREDGTLICEVNQAVPADREWSAIRAGSSLPAGPQEWRRHSHPVHELVWVRGGSLTACVGELIFTVTEGFGLWIPAGEMHAGRSTANVEFHEAVFEPRTARTIFPEATVVTMSPLLQALLVHLASPDLSAEERNRAEGVVFDVLEPTGRNVALRLPGDARIAPILEALLTDPSDSRGLEAWARQLGISDRTIARRFHALTGLSFTQWRRVLRIHHALKLLSTGSDVQETSRQLGYAHPSTFIVAFRRVMGTTPGAFLESLRSP
ncbi:helix-turn-helix transcriptional regulator [Kocuria coralli]|uniref:HTH-type transcriptional regulator RipA n=1 Tax=Kocuria coralli TaxID=1461025 RepID=A0A5J5KVF3_9MICC|nr:AraC family transcriptional regulator [Kocuria coralli]KAA9392911.1 helix-turn-helix transcriptional regulator [Kocuria coralli]